MQKLTLKAQGRFPVRKEPNAFEAMYIIKIKGKAKIPDYIQLRDEHFTLIAYFRADRPLKKLEKYGLEGKEVALQEVINDLPFGKLQKLEI